MKKVFRISAGAIVIHEEKVLLVRYMDKPGESYLVGPGGGVYINESTNQAAIREVKEETNLDVSVGKVIFIEDLLSKRHQITKIWFLCNLKGGRLVKTQEAIEEGIIEVGWYRRDQLNNEVVYPTVLLSHNWDDFYRDNWQTIYNELREVDFDLPRREK
jgi:8-oxo-dGTP diphosphatase